MAELKSRPVLHGTQLHVHVQAGIVTISGRVNSLNQRQAAERAAQRVTGINTLILAIRAAIIPITVTTVAADARNDDDGLVFAG